LIYILSIEPPLASDNGVTLPFRINVKEVSSMNCATKYPIMLIHGTGFRDRKYFNYWGRIPKALEEQGATLFYGHQDSWGSIEYNADVLKITGGRFSSVVENGGVSPSLATLCPPYVSGNGTHNELFLIKGSAFQFEMRSFS